VADAAISNISRDLKREIAQNNRSSPAARRPSM
jgi:hypothetical protein